MKLTTVLPILTVGLTSLTAWALTGCKSAPERTAKNQQLPASCTLLAMPPEERWAHERRLETLRKSARFERETSDGFEFTVDLRQMSARDLELWMANEQKCCSFLRMTSHVNKALAHVRVECSSDLRTQVVETFGLLSSTRSR